MPFVLCLLKTKVKYQQILFSGRDLKPEDKGRVLEAATECERCLNLSIIFQYQFVSSCFVIIFLFSFDATTGEQTLKKIQTSLIDVIFCK